MSQLFQIALTKAHLDHIPPDERVFYLVAGQLSNEINILTKLLWFAFNQYRATDGVLNEAALAQILLIVKLLAGKLYEGYRFIGKAFSAKKLYQKYKGNLNEDARDALHKINRYFGDADNIVQKIRHEFAFHSGTKEVEKIYSHLAQTETLPEYWGIEYGGYNLFFGGELITVKAMLKVTGEPDQGKALVKMFSEITEIPVWFNIFVQNYNSLLLSIFLGMTQRDVDLRAPRITLTDEPKIDEVPLPYFCLPPERLP
jgi:hypothetical protein